MTDWKPKFKVGDTVRSTRTGQKLIVPIEYNERPEFISAKELNTDRYLTFSFKHFEHNMERFGFDTEAESPVTPTPPTPSVPTPTKPNYYRFEVRGVAVDIIDVIQGLGLGCEAGNVYKYLARAGKKDASKHIEDLEKAREWLDRLIEYRRRS